MKIHNRANYSRHDFIGIVCCGCSKRRPEYTIFVFPDDEIAIGICKNCLVKRKLEGRMNRAEIIKLSKMDRIVQWYLYMKFFIGKTEGERNEIDRAWLLRL